MRLRPIVDCQCGIVATIEALNNRLCKAFLMTPTLRGWTRRILPHQEPGKRLWQRIARGAIAALADLTGESASCRNWCACQTSICLHIRMGPKGSGASQHGFAAFKCALALHTLAKLHELLTHCALAELQNSGHCSSQHGASAAVGASQSLVRLARDGMTCCVFSLLIKPFLFVT